MSMTMAASSMSSMAAMPAATSGMGMSMGGMNVVFVSSETTALFSFAWTPSTTGQYAGTCIFLIVFTVIFRGLLALKSSLESTVWADRALNGHPGLPISDFEHAHEKNAAAGLRSVWTQRSPWRLATDGWRAVLDTVTVGVGYLLMLAVMSMNIGYFASILAGTFLGSILVGRFTAGGAGAC